MDDLSGGIAQLRQMINSSSTVVVFTGAGISTESGIPDFRSPGGLWAENKPIQFSDFMASESVRREAWRRKFNIDATIQGAVPNAGHAAISQWVGQGKVAQVITQNVDGLHQASGVPREQVIELHGNTTYAHCLDCGERYELAPIRAALEGEGLLPQCDLCQGIVKTATVSFGQAMPEREMALAERAARQCDLFIAIGSSLVVYPAAGLPLLARQSGAQLVILNREPTEHDSMANLVLHGEIGPILTALLA